MCVCVCVCVCDVVWCVWCGVVCVIAFLLLMQQYEFIGCQLLVMFVHQLVNVLVIHLQSYGLSQGQCPQQQARPQEKTHKNHVHEQSGHSFLREELRVLMVTPHLEVYLAAPVIH